jgi:hypothetical protein
VAAEATLQCWQFGCMQSSPSHHTFTDPLLTYFPYFEKNKSRTMRSLCCPCLCIPPSKQHLNPWTNIYETWYVYHSTWAHLRGLLHKFPSACVSVYVSSLVARQKLHSRKEYMRNKRRIVGRIFYHAVRVVSKESGLLVHPRSSCLYSRLRVSLYLPRGISF